MHSLFIDTFNTLTSQLQSNAIHILTHPNKISDKIQTFNLQLAQFKCGVLSMLQNAIKQQKQSKNKQKYELIECEMQQQIKNNKDKLTRLRLHHILKRKLQKQKKQSMIGSSIISQNSSVIMLQKSVLMIQKDLGIQNQSDSISQRLGLSNVISRSLITSTPSRNDKLNDYSIVSEIDSLPCIDSSIDIEKIEIPSISNNFSKQNVADNSKQTRYQQQSKPKQQKQTKKNQTVKKIKKTGFTKIDSSKEGLLDNLLQQSFNTCVDKK